MEIDGEHIEFSESHGNNPLFNRFKHLPHKSKSQFPRVAYVLQGGGSLGAYQFGVVKGLCEAGYEPDWVAATSIGAIQAAIIVGNPPAKRIEKLTQFWDRIAPPSMIDYLGKNDATIDIYNQLSAFSAFMFGQPHFFYPRWFEGTSPPFTLSFYDTAPLRETLIELVDFDLLNSCPIRLSLGAVQNLSGHLIYFNNINYIIRPEHVMASAALPPGFPAVDVDGQLYWDGAIHSNTPLEVILEAIPPENTLCFLIDCFGGQPFIPSDLDEVRARMEDISYGTHAQRCLLNYLERQRRYHAIKELGKLLTKEQRKQHADLLNVPNPHHCTIVHMAYHERFVRSATKDFNFGKMMIDRRINSGFADVQSLLVKQTEWGVVPKKGESRLYECSENHTSLLRKYDVSPMEL